MSVDLYSPYLENYTREGKQCPWSYTPDNNNIWSQGYSSYRWQGQPQQGSFLPTPPDMGLTYNTDSALNAPLGPSQTVPAPTSKRRHQHFVPQEPNNWFNRECYNSNLYNCPVYFPVNPPQTRPVGLGQYNHFGQPSRAPQQSQQSQQWDYDYQRPMNQNTKYNRPYLNMGPQAPVQQYYQPYPEPQPYQPPKSEVVDSEYQLESMSEFVSSMALGIMSSGSGVFFEPGQHNALREFLCVLLRSTRLSRATIMLSLVYLGKRWDLGSPPRSSPQDIYLFMVLAMAFANKVHDDNTFTNLSWSQASGIPAKRISALEIEWLQLMDWNVHPTHEIMELWQAWNAYYVSYSASSSSPVSYSGALFEAGRQPQSVAVY